MRAESAWLAGCRASHASFLRALERPREAQAATLARLLRANAGSAYGRRHRFSTLRTAREFQEAVPVSTYEELRPWIDRIAAGEEGVLTREPVAMLEATSGSQGAEKLVPYTASLRLEYGRAVRAWLFDLYSKRPALAGGAAYWCVTPLARRRRRTSGGLPIGFDDDTEYLGGRAGRLLRRLLAVPPEVGRCADLETALYATLRFLAQTPGLAFVSIWSPSFLSILEDRLRAHAERLLDDLERGRLSPPAPLSAGLARALAPRLLADPDRARALRGRGVTLRDLCPRVSLVSCWADAAARPLLPAMRRLLPGAQVQGKGLLATEGVVSIPLVGLPGAALAITSHFLEFSPGACERPLLAHQLERGGVYRVLLTTGGGLWRYDLGDRVRMVGRAGRTPLVEFVGRAGPVSDLRGEKLHAAFVEGALERLREGGSLGDGFAMLAPVDGGPPAYCLFFDGRARGDLARRLDEALRRNPHYEYCRSLGQLAPARLFRIHAGAAADYARRCGRPGQRAGSVKPTALHAGGGWEEVFRGRFAASPP